jgi:hypothetical protein
MALSFGDIAMAFGTGVMKGANEDQKRRQERLDERFKELQNNKLEVAKSKHASEYKQYMERKVKVDALKSSGEGIDRVATYMMNRGIDADKAYKFAAANPNFTIPESAYDYGQEPLMDYDVVLNEDNIPIAPNYLADSMRRVLGGGGTEDSRKKSIEQQTSEVFSKKKDYQTPAQQANIITAEQSDLMDVPVSVDKRPQRIQETSIPAQTYPIDTGYSLDGVTPQQLPEQTEAAPITATKVEAAPAAVDMTVPEPEAVDYSSLYAADPTAEMRNRGSVANLLMEMDPTLDPKAAEQKALELDNLQVSPVTGRMVNKLNYVLGRPSGVEEIRAERAIEKQPDISMRDMGKSITAYLKTDPYNGTIENEADYMFDLTDMTRNIRSEFGLGTGEARNVAELMLLPDVGAIAKQDTYMPDLLEDNYTYDPAGSIDLPTLRMAMKKNPGKSPRQIITRIRELRMRAAQQ